MTDIQQAIHAFITEFIASHGYAPTHREIAAGVNYNRGWVVVNLELLREMGLIDYRERTARSIRVLKPTEAVR